MNLLSSSTRPVILVLFLFSLSINYSKAQSGFGINQINVWGDFAFASPAKALKGPYSDGNAMQLYYGVDIPFAFLQYGKKSNMGFSFAGFLGHEKGNFTDNSYITDGLDAKLTSYGIRFKPLTLKRIDPNKFKQQEEGNDQIQNFKNDLAFSKNFFTVVISGLYFDYGMSSAALIQPPTPDVHRNPTVFGYGLAYMFGLNKKLGIGLDLGIRNYNWTNSSNTQSSIKSIHMGFGLGFKI